MEYTWLVYIGVFLFALGIFLVVSRKNAIMALIGIELILNAAMLNFIAFSANDPELITGQMAALFIMVIAAAEVAVGLAILLNIFKRTQTVNLDEIDSMRE